MGRNAIPSFSRQPSDRVSVGRLGRLPKPSPKPLHLEAVARIVALEQSRKSSKFRVSDRSRGIGEPARRLRSSHPHPVREERQDRLARFSQTTGQTQSEYCGHTVGEEPQEAVCDTKCRPGETLCAAVSSAWTIAQSTQCELCKA